jgi:DNA-directed RNA polymerase alpha subunit
MIATRIGVLSGINTVPEFTTLFDEVHSIVSREKGSQDSLLDLEAKIANLDLSNRAKNALAAEGIENVKQLIQRSRSQLAQVPNLGLRTLVEIEDFVEHHGLSLCLQG